MNYESRIKKIFLILISLFLVLAFASSTEAAILSLSPTTGTFVVDSTFEVSVYLNSEGEPVNTLAISIKFPPDKLQLVSPSTGKSIIDIWLTPPKYNNQTGIVELKGGIPGGINVGKGLITTLTFRVKGLGESIVKFLDGSMVLLNDGRGTDALRNTESAIYHTVLPPPAGPTVISPSHPDQSLWYSNPTVVLQWGTEEAVEGYSYILNDEMTQEPDNISEGLKDTMAYKNLGNGRRFFHIKALRKGVWGGTTHFMINIDTAPPAEFPIEISPDTRTTKIQPIINFITTDALSGIDRYELKIVPLNPGEGNELNGFGTQTLFIDAQSPYISQELPLGSYDVIVRAYDKAGNYRESVQRMEIVTALFRFIADKGIEIRGLLIIPWFWFWLVVIILLLLLALSAVYLRHRHRLLDMESPRRELPPVVKEQLSELQKYRDRYGKMSAILLFFLLGGGLLIFGQPANGQAIQMSPPFISTISKNISNEEIFYAGGKTDVALTEVIIYLQNLQTGETLSSTVVSDKSGSWFYRHNMFLTSGNYLLWVQSRRGEDMSPPSPQINMTVRATAVQFGASRVSYEVLYLFLMIFVSVVAVILVVYIIFHGYYIRKKRAQFMKEVKEAEEAVRRGFAVLRRDIQAELAIVKEIKMTRELAAREAEKEERLLKDLEEVEKYIGKEIFDIEKAEYSD